MGVHAWVNMESGAGHRREGRERREESRGCQMDMTLRHSLAGYLDW